MVSRGCPFKCPVCERLCSFDVAQSKTRESVDLVLSSKFRVPSSARRRRLTKLETSRDIAKPLRGAELGTPNLELRTWNCSSQGRTGTGFTHVINPTGFISVTPSREFATHRPPKTQPSQKPMSTRLLATFTTLCLLSPLAPSADWPTWRGP